LRLAAAVAAGKWRRTKRRKRRTMMGASVGRGAADVRRMSSCSAGPLGGHVDADADDDVDSFRSFPAAEEAGGGSDAAADAVDDEFRAH